MEDTDTPALHIAEAYEHVAKVNHYLVCVSGRDYWSIDQFDAAEQILIARQNALKPGQDRAQWRRLELALDILAYDRQRRSYPHNAASSAA